MKFIKTKKLFIAIVCVAISACAMLAVGCSDKADNKKPSDKPPCAHVSTSAVVVGVADCTNDGLTRYVCDACHETVREEVKPALGHDYSKAEENGLCVTCNHKICSPGMTYELTADERGYIVSDPGRRGVDNVVIPEYHGGKPVVQIASNAFNARKDVVSVSIPKTVEVIDVGVFNGCTGLKNVYYNAERVQDFRGINWVFYFSSDAPRLNVTIGKNVKRIPARLFYPHNAYGDIIPVIDKLVFEDGCKLEEIGEYAFYKTNITAIDLPDTLKSIGAHAFESSAVTELGFGSSLEVIGAHAFDYCIGLKSVDLSGTDLSLVDDSAFRNCGELENVTLPSRACTVGLKTFYGCAKLESAALGGATHIGEQAFYGCALDELVLPASLISVGNSAFENCSAISKITVECTALSALPAGNRVFYGAGVPAGVNVAIAASVRALPDRLFYSTADPENNIRIAKLEIAVGIESIGLNAFRGVTIGETVYAGTAKQFASVIIAGGNDAVGTPVFKGVA